MFFGSNPVSERAPRDKIMHLCLDAHSLVDTSLLPNVLINFNGRIAVFNGRDHREPLRGYVLWGPSTLTDHCKNHLSSVVFPSRTDAEDTTLQSAFLSHVDARH